MVSINIKLIIRILVVLIATPLFGVKVFPANHGSVLLENQYAEEANIPRYETQKEVSRAIEIGALVPIPITVAPRLPIERRFIRRSGAEFMQELDARFYLATGHFLIVDSAVRPISVQRRLCRQNRSAAPATGQRASSHERGTTFDLAKKNYANGHVDRMKKAQYRLLLMWLAYYQGAGRVHVIEERACLHVMVREDEIWLLSKVTVKTANEFSALDSSTSIAGWTSYSGNTDLGIDGIDTAGAESERQSISSEKTARKQPSFTSSEIVEPYPTNGFTTRRH